MPQQTLREETMQEEFKEFMWNYFDKHNIIPSTAQISEWWLARFKEFAEKELIGSNKVAVKGVGIHGGLTHEEIARNALRNEQREILAEYFK